MKFNEITELNKKLTKFRPMDKASLNVLKEHDRIEQIYSSTALEGNTITASETKMILEKGITISGKSMREHLEIVNLNGAIDYVEDLVRGNEPLNESNLKQIHFLVYNNTSKYDMKDVAGVYRKVDVQILGSEHKPPSAYLVQDEMDDFFKWVEVNKDKLHPIEYASQVHLKFVTIHPFIDGNGRVARLLMNFALTSKGYPPIAIKPDNESRTRYNKALEHAQVTGDSSDFTDIVYELSKEKLTSMLRNLETYNDLNKQKSKINNELER
nr:Fic family protein [Clostridioides sp.]